MATSSITRRDFVNTLALHVVAVLLGVAVFGATDIRADEKGDSTYGGWISVPAKMRPELKAAVEDLRTHLQQITGSEFKVTSEPVESGIVLRRDDAADTPREAAKLVPNPSKEAFCLWPEDNKKRLWLVGRTDAGLSHAIYVYLEQLGCRWYFPSEKWRIVPTRKDITLAKPLAVQPVFRSRNFAGTGGFGGNLPLDPERRLQARWADWERRNRFGGEYRLAGHTGEAFNVKYRKELESHPEWRAMIDGKRRPWAVVAQFCVGNQEVVDLYVQDRLEAYRKMRKQDPESPHAWAVSVEPADGGGHCTAPESLKIGSVSDRVFHVANEAAKAVRREFPKDGYVSLLAYNEHAAVPSIPIEPNVYVVVTPYGFQRTGLSPDQLLDAWSRKVPRMGIYDYWSIPDWSHDLPDFDPLGHGPNRLRSWHRRGVDGFLCESTYSSGAMGLTWYITSRLTWQPEANVEAIFEGFLRDCFGPAHEPMRRMLRRWSDGFYLNSHELALSYRDVDEAWKLAEGKPEVAARVADYGRYVEYLRRRFDYLQTPPKSDQRRQAAERLMTYLWSIYDSSMIHAFRHSQLLARDEKLAGDDGLLVKYDWTKAKAPGWATIRRASDDDVHKLVRGSVAELQPQKFVPRRFTGPLVPLKPAIIEAKEIEWTPVFTPYDLEFHVLADRDDFTLPLRVATEKPVRLLVTSPDGKSILNQEIVTGPKWQSEWTETKIVLPKKGLYRLQIVSQKRQYRFAAPVAAKLTISPWWNSQGWPTPRLYFYVPAATTQLALYAHYTAAGPPRFFDPTGKEIKPQLVDNGHLLLIDIPAEYRGAVWSLDRAKCANGPLRPLNAPAAFAFAPDTLLVPQDALTEAKPK